MAEQELSVDDLKSALQYRGSAATHCLILKECKGDLGATNYGKVISESFPTAETTLQKRLPDLLTSYNESIQRNERAKVILGSTDVLVTGSIAAGVLLLAAPPVGIALVAVTASAWVLDKSFETAMNKLDDYGRSEARSILKHQLAVYSEANPGLDLSKLKDKSPEEILAILESNAPIFDSELDTVDKADRDMVEAFRLREIYKQVIHGDLQILDLEKKNQDEIKAVSKELTNVSRTVVQFARETNAQLKEIKDQQQGIETDLGVMKDELQKQSGDLRFIKNFLFGKMTVSEQRTALRAGMRSDLTADERKALDQKLSILEKQERFIAGVDTYLNGASTLLNIAGRLGVDPSVVRTAQQAVQVGQVSSAAIKALASGNYLQAASAVAGLIFGGGKDQETLRHEQVMEKLNEISDKLNTVISELRVMRQEILQGFKTIYEALVQVSNMVAQYHNEEMKMLDELRLDSIYTQGMLIDNIGMSHCETFLGSRTDKQYSFSGTAFPNYGLRCKHFEANAGSYWAGWAALRKVLSFDSRINTLFGIQAPQKLGADEKEIVAKWRSEKYEPLLTFVRARPNLLGGTPDQFFSMFLLPATTVLQVSVDTAVQSIDDLDRFEITINEHMDLPLSPFTVTRCLTYLIELFGYCELTVAIDSRKLWPIKELVQGKQAAETVLLKKALAIIDVAIAQQALLAGHLMLVVFDRCYRSGTQDAKAKAKELLETSPLLLRNFVLYRMCHEMDRQKISLFTYEAALTISQTDLLLKGIAEFPWTYKYRKAGEKLDENDKGDTSRQLGSDCWTLQVGSRYLPLPSRQEVAAGVIDYGDQMETLVQLRSRIAAEWANYDFLRNGSEETELFETLKMASAYSV